MDGLAYGSRRPDRSPRRTPAAVETRILRMRRRHPTWGAKRIRAYLARSGVRIHWRTVHDVLVRNGLLVRVRRRPKPMRRFQRHHVDSLWQMDAYEFRISGVGKVHVFTVLDDRSRYLVMARAYRRHRAREAVNALWWALKGGRRPLAVYVDNGTCFVARDFKAFCAAQGIRVIYGRPYNPQGRGKLERFHETMHEELTSQVRFRTLSHFRRELWLYRRRYNRLRLHGGIEWRTPHEVYHDRKLMRRRRIPLRKRTHVPPT